VFEGLFFPMYSRMAQLMTLWKVTDIVFDDFFDVITIKNAAGYAPLELRRISTHNAGF
jgi:hypothetical protein